MKKKHLAAALSLISPLLVVHHCLAADEVRVSLGRFALYAESIEDSARGAVPAVSQAGQDSGHRAGYGIGLRYRYMKSLSGGLELRRHDYFVDDNLKGEHPRNSVMFTLGLHF